MKIMSLILTVLVCFTQYVFPQKNGTPDITYAQIKQGASMYYKSDGIYTEAFLLPATYFVAILSDGGDGFYNVSYLDITGYVKKDYVEKVDYEPKYKYAEVTLTLNSDDNPANVRSQPNHLDSANIIAKPADKSVLSYYGTQKGSEQKAEIGTTWYYVKAASGDKTVRGYIYSMYVKAESIPDNVIEKVEPEPQSPSETVIEIDNVKATIIIVSLCVPVVIVMFLLFKKRPERHIRHYDE